MRWDGLWRRGVGAVEDPDNGRLILRATGISRIQWALGHESWPARIRAAYWYIVRRYDSEVCQRCGRPVGVVFHVPDAVWEVVTGHARFPDGEAAPGILCIRCVNELYAERAHDFLRWTCATDDTVMRG